MNRAGGWLALVALCTCCSGLVSAREIRLASGEWAPYLSEKSRHFGFASHIVTEAFKQAGVQVRYEFYPWARSEALVKVGAVDGSLVWSQTSQRQTFAWFSDTVMTEEEVVFHLKSTPLVWEHISDLHGRKMGIPLGSKPGRWEEAIQSGKLVSYPVQDIETGMKMLLAGRIDIFPLVKTVGYDTLRKKFSAEEAGKIGYSQRIVERIEYRLMLSKKQDPNRVLLEKFNEGLKKLKKSEVYQEMLRGLERGDYE
ncbi:substrate-binding periplasmic protein [Parachitinimonas caeni]|uniref:Transporter substrate-binding domain-containing protein n=1 Tax=Parachitinimonas caeni TaxID=3031301 RepID=A0ABT7DX00_9NEIS|nr:transporter substrate-binding domain-containing protein [Parachitinimonas caeni]MDK2124596.1 transporter substrate-binding domain-containing protein [Parachitinimonas caeni]